MRGRSNQTIIDFIKGLLMTIYDVVIVGSGIAGNILAAELSQKKMKVLILEAGPLNRSREEMVQKFWGSVPKLPSSPYDDSPFAPRPTVLTVNEFYDQKGPDIFASTYERLTGGTTWHWLGTTPRLLPKDFSMKTTYGKGENWPFTYAHLEPWYCLAEQEIGVAGNSKDDLGSPRSKPYPFRQISHSYLDKVVMDTLTNKDFNGIRLKVSATPQARNPDICLGSRSCIPICPTGAKYEARIHLEKALANGAELKTQSVVYHLGLDSTGQISELKYKTWDNTSHIVKATHYVLAAGAIENTKLLLLSKQDGAPNGIANQSDQVGRNLMDHPSFLSWAMSKEPLFPYRGPPSTAGIDTHRDGSFRKQRAAFRVQLQNDGWSWPKNAPASTAKELIEKGLFGSKLNAALKEQCSRQFFLVSMLEQIPHPENRVMLSTIKKDALGLPHPQIQYALSDYEKQGLQAAKDMHEFIFKEMNAIDIRHKPFNEYQSAQHIMGTHRMGENPKSSVVNSNLQSHDHPNLYLLGAGNFPTAGTANPSLTIAALSLRFANYLTG